MAETIEVNGTEVQFVEPCENTELATINYDDGELEEITPAQMALGTAIVGGVSIALWEGGKWLWRKAIGPMCEKLGDKFKAQKEEAEKRKENKVIDGEYAEDEKTSKELEEKKKELQNQYNSDSKRKKH